MKLLDHIGDALLAKLVPGIDAKAGCGRCTASGYDCRCCREGISAKRTFYYDACGRFCYTTCLHSLAYLDRPSGIC